MDRFYRRHQHYGGPRNRCRRERQCGRRPDGAGRQDRDFFSLAEAQLSRTIIAGPFSDSVSVAAACTCIFSRAKSSFAASYADTAAKEHEYFSGLYGAAPVDRSSSWWNCRTTPCLPHGRRRLRPWLTRDISEK